MDHPSLREPYSQSAPQIRKKILNNYSKCSLAYLGESGRVSKASPESPASIKSPPTPRRRSQEPCLIPGNRRFPRRVGLRRRLLSLSVRVTHHALSLSAPRQSR